MISGADSVNIFGFMNNPECIATLSTIHARFQSQA